MPIAATQRAITRAVRHLAGWVDHQLGGPRDTTRRPARLTYFRSGRRRNTPCEQER